MKFPLIADLETFKNRVATKDEIKFNEQPNGSIVGCYMVSMPTTFNIPEAIECRGIVFNEGHIAGRPLHKFFNVGEKEHTRLENLDWSTVARVMDKRDGSMIHTVRLPWGYDVKSKKSYMSDVAVAARKLIKLTPKLDRFCKHVVESNKTAIFEYTAPTARIVLYYPDECLTLLHIRDNFTGAYMPAKELVCWATRFDVPVVAELPELLTAMREDPLALMEHTQQVEGWVVQFASGEMVKLKTKWYLERHRAMTFLRERDIVKLVLSEGLDDLKSLLVAEGASIAEIEEIETRAVLELNSIDAAVKATIAELQELSLKDAAIKMQADNHPYFGLVMATMRGKNPDIKDWFTKHRLDAYSLRQLNILQSVGELE